MCKFLICLYVPWTAGQIFLSLFVSSNDGLHSCLNTVTLFQSLAPYYHSFKTLVELI